MGKILNSREIGWKIRSMRQQAGLTQDALAERIGVTAQQIQKYETGASKLNTDRLQQMARVFSIPEQAFFSGVNEHLPLAVAEQTLVDAYRAIPSRDIRESILKIAANASEKSK